MNIEEASQRSIKWILDAFRSFRDLQDEVAHVVCGAAHPLCGDQQPILASEA